MARRWRAVTGFAVAGFVIAWILLAYSEYCAAHRIRPMQELFLFLCPPSIGSVALDRASTVDAMVGWLLISLFNAALYAGLGVLVALLPRRSN